MGCKRSAIGRELDNLRDSLDVDSVDNDAVLVFGDKGEKDGFIEKVRDIGWTVLPRLEQQDVRYRLRVFLARNAPGQTVYR